MVEKTRELVADCRAIVIASPTHHLPLNARQRLWASFGERLDPAEVRAGAISPGHDRRGRLAIYAVRSVLPWYAADEARAGADLVNSTDHPTKILDVAERRLDRIDDWASTERTAYRYGNMLQYIYELWQDYEVASLILLGAGGAIGSCICDHLWLEAEDEGPDTEGWTPEMYACLAFCDGASPWVQDETQGERQGELNARREAFWLQYLAKAAELAVAAHNFR
ncbi:Imm5 family immunity protein [Paraburkholderia sp. CNPSo 3281]|uniref:Imm5 family immunity protein n=1 Tax=Paraburkholderia sp. CNPSo 3281 TaxID=2940933 RepID=UPI0020B6B6C3|nr:Imm5 family immunity protein [Paraburkholderia sp. CNPSo 3281]MCP3720295.1 Imm5 family immunity protein [Paraburkholderia sp. CNPSo 3281]